MIQVRIVDEKNETQRLAEVIIAQEEVDREYSRSFDRMRREAVLPGFRRGKVPLELVKKKYGSEIRAEVFDRLFEVSYQEVLTQTHWVPIDRPQVENLELAPGMPLKYQLKLEVLPKVKLGNYRGFKLKAPSAEVSPEEILHVLERLRERLAILEPVEGRAAQTGDVLTVDFDGKRDGVSIKGMKTEGYQLELGRGHAIADFENNLTGMVLGETKIFTAVFPADYHAGEMAGQTVEFAASIKAIQQKKLPEINEEFAKSAGPFEDIEALKKQISADLGRDKERERRLHLRHLILDELGKIAQVKVPDILIERSIKRLWEDEIKKRQQHPVESGVDLLDWEGFQESQHEQVAAELKSQLALREVGLLEKVEVSEQDIQIELERMAAGTRQTPQRWREYFDRTHGWDDLRDRLRDDKVLDILIAQAKISEAK